MYTDVLQLYSSRIGQIIPRLSDIIYLNVSYIFSEIPEECASLLYSALKAWNIVDKMH